MHRLYKFQAPWPTLAYIDIVNNCVRIPTYGLAYVRYTLHTLEVRWRYVALIGRVRWSYADILYAGMTNSV